MPIIEYLCENNHRTEIIYLTIKEVKDKIICEVCDKYNLDEENGLFFAEKIYSTFNTAQVGKPSIIFRNPQNGAIQVATGEHEQVPKGFVKEELKSPFERTKFEREYNERMRVQDEIQTEKRRLETSENQKNRQDNLKSRLSSIAAKTDNPSMTKQLVKNAMMRNRKKERVPKKKTNFHFEVN